MSAKYKSPSFLLPNELNTSANTVNNTGINSLYSMSFAGNSGSATLGGLTSTIIQGDLLTISCWYYPTNIGSSDYIIGSGSSSYGPFTLERNAANIRIRWTRSSGTNPVNVTTTDSPMQINLWYHICAIFDTTNSTATDKIQIWINGVRNTTGDVSLTGSGFSSTYASTDTWINRFRTNSPSLKTNSVDELAFFNKALTSTEIAALYDGTGSNIRPSNLMATNLGPIAYYPLGEQAQNSGYPGSTTPANNVWQFPNGVLQDYVMDFENSSNQYISGNASLPNSDYTISAWINLETVTTESIVTWGEDATGKRRSLFIWNGGGGAYRLYSSTYGSNIGGSTTLLTGQWYHAAVTVSSAGVTNIYLNGSPDGTGTNTLNSFTGTNFYIGRTPSGEYFDGKISNVQIFNSVIPGTGTNSIETLYNNSSPLTDMSGFTSLTNWWKLNADSVYTPSAPNYTTSLDFVSSQSDYISFATGSTIARTQNLTFSAWINERSGTIMGNRSSSNFGVSLYFYNNILIFQLGNDSNDSFNNSVVANVYNYINNGEWSHIAATWDGTTSKIYINNIERNSWTPSSTLTISGWNDFGIGKRAGSNSGYVNGQISNCAVWDKALSSSQVSTLFNFGTPETNISFDPTAWWKLDDQNAITDYSGNGNTGSNNGATNSPGGVAYAPSWKIPSALPITSAANYTTALDFGGSDYIDCGNNSSLVPSSLTISLWFKTSGSASAIPRLINKSYSASAPYDSYFININNNVLNFKIGVSSASVKIAGATNVVDGKWHHVVGTYDGSQLKLYLDGNSEATPVSETRAIIENTTYNLTIGCELGAYNFSWPFTGDISNVSIFDSALTAPQVSTLYNGGTPETAISFLPVSWWKLDTGGSTITDYGSGGNTGNNNGASPITSDVLTTQPVNGVSTTLPSTALQQSDLQFDSPYSNYSLSFDGSNWIDCSNSSILNIFNNISISAWVKASSFANYDLIIGRSTNNDYDFGISGGGGIGVLRFHTGNGTTQEYVDSAGFSLALNQWYHVAIVRTVTPNQITFFINGQQLNTVALSYTPTGSLTTITRIGSRSGTFGFNGEIDETALWSTALTSAQILEIYNNGRPKDLTTFSGIAPISWWRLGENAYFQDSTLVLPNSITGAPNGEASTNNVEMISADAPGTYANGIGTNLDILDRVGNAPLSVANSQSYNMIPDDKVPYVPGYVGAQIANTSEMTFNGVDSFFDTGNVDLGINSTLSMWFKPGTSPVVNDYALIGEGSNNFDYLVRRASGNAFYVWVGGSSTGYANFGFTIANNIIVGSWNFLAIQKAGDTITVYLKNTNGEFKSTATLSLWATASMTFDRIGSRTISPPAQVFSGQIDEVAGFSEALTPDQIKFDLYEATTPGKTADIENNTNLPTPVAWYRMGD